MFSYLYKIFLDILQLFGVNNFSQITYEAEELSNKEIIDNDLIVPISYDSNEGYYYSQSFMSWLF